MDDLPAHRLQYRLGLGKDRGIAADHEGQGRSRRADGATGHGASTI